MNPVAPRRIAAAVSAQTPRVEDVRRRVEILVQTRTAWQPTGPGADDPARVAAPAEPVVVDWWAEDLVARLAAGATVRATQAALAPHGLRLAVATPGPERTTLGAVFARGERGFRSDLGGHLRERVLGLRAIDGAGRLTCAGARVVKNVAGYDMSRLHHGAGGAFGIVLDFLVRLDARPEVSAAFWIPARDRDPWEILAAVRRPAAPLDPCVQLWVGAATARALECGEEPGLVVAVEGWSAAVQRWQQTLHEMGPQPIDLERLRELFDFDASPVAVRWSAPPSAPAVWRELTAALPGAHLAIDLAADTATLTAPGLEWSRVGPAVDRVAPRGWFTTRAPAAHTTSTVGPPESRIVKRLKAAFDPHALLPPVPAPVRWGRP